MAAVRLLAGAARRRPALGRRLLATGPAAGEYDVAVVGGGIVGAAVARVSAGRAAGVWAPPGSPPGAPRAAPRGAPRCPGPWPPGSRGPTAPQSPSDRGRGLTRAAADDPRPGPAAQELAQRRPGARLALLEKEAAVAAHQTGHNSGVIHCGIYYTPGSLKARLCVEGVRLAYAYIREKGIPHANCGKLIVALEDWEVGKLRALYENGRTNGVPELTFLASPAEVRAVEPHCAGIAAIRCGTTGVVDWGQVARAFADDFAAAGGAVLTGHEVVGFQSPGPGPRFGAGVALEVAGGRPDVRCRHAIVCGGLQSDQLARASGGDPDPRIVPFRGEYLVLKPGKRHLVKGNIYPVPDPRVPFLGVHFTPRVNGEMWLGPNAVLAFKREGYGWGDVSLRDVWDAVTYVGFQRLARSHFAFGLDEFWRSLNVRAQVRKLARYVPELTVDDVEPGPTGVRAMAVSPDGKMVDDFVFECIAEEAGEVGRVLHVRNAPSPAATSSMAIAKEVAAEAIAKFRL